MTTKQLALLATITLAFAACKKDDDEPTPTTGTLALSWGFHWSGPDFELGETYTDDFGHAIVINELRYFISDILFQHGDNTVGNFHNTRLLLSAEEEGVVTLGSLSPTAIDSVELSFGLDATLNHSDPATASPPLDDVTMHSGNTTDGYYFLVIEGQVDDDGDGTVDAGDPSFSYRCATDALLRRVTKPDAFTITAGTTAYPHLHFQVDEVLAGIDVLANLSAVGAQPVNIQLMDQLVEAAEME